MAADQGIFVPLLLGIVEGLTEFLPVSSTAHILLLGEWLGFENPGSSFEVLIQLGAILAIVTIYFKKNYWIWPSTRCAANHTRSNLRWASCWLHCPQHSLG